ncbi:Ribosomal protein L11 methyltransferase [Frankliniella fusca]|uniref:Ribosomal protein L11 methyltransferase n=1 Tax=Frankliniella fusca TaxID=407009 RepID=A0AAE1H3Q9_9NEOP|nr:Ribosomal protein L11 methyltransferase [Frankliniella fusca]KAK3914366.1 Ribosomal protein L11 methyltransferase [Frankliniella fusca]
MGCGAGVFSLGILGSTGCRSSTQGPAAKSQVFKLRCLQHAGCERCHLGHQRRSEGEDTQQEKYYVHFFIDVFHSCNVNDSSTLWLLCLDWWSRQGFPSIILDPLVEQ